MRSTCLDLDPRGAGAPWSAVIDELLADDDEQQIAYRGGERFVARLKPWADVRDTKGLLVPQGAHRLQITARGSLEQLAIQAADAPPPGPGEVRLEIAAAGLNFRDVLNTLGRYPGDPGELGMECAGRIRDVGADVEGWEVGERVVALAPGSLATSVTVSSALIAKLPQSLTDAEAASVPVVFATAELGLNRLAQLKRGERVLIHAAAGGVGWAAIEIARSVGAEIFATASREKWAYLRRQGIRHVYNSRSLEFADQIRHDTQGEGVHVVLNSLAGEFIPTSLDLLTTGGRFVELGKQAIWTHEQVAAVRPDVHYHVLALDQRMQQQPQATGAVLRYVLEQIANGRWHTPPLTCFPLHSAPRAMRRLQQGQQLGKCVLICGHDEQRAIRADGSYVIVGWGGLGQVVLAWLAKHGAKRVGIVSRRAPDAQQAAQLDELRQRGIRVQHYAADASDAVQLQHALEHCRAQLGELRGVFHLAGVLDDGLVERQDAARLERVWRPKVTAAWHLHRLTRCWPLDHFVLFSSSSGVLEPRGKRTTLPPMPRSMPWRQNANAKDSPAVSIAWGPWSGTGMAARLDDASRARWQDRGVRFIEPELGAALLDRIVCGDAQQIVAFRANWSRYRAHHPQDSLLSELGELAAHKAEPNRGDHSQQPLAARLAHVVAGDSLPVIRDWLVEHVRNTLGWPESRLVDPAIPLADQGLDSLMAVELLHQLRGELQPLMSVPPTLLFDYPCSTIWWHSCIAIDNIAVGCMRRPNPTKEHS